MPLTPRPHRPLLAAGCAGVLALSLAPAAHAEQDRYVALGDSFSAGTGTRAEVDPCYRSPYGYPVLLADRHSLTLDYQACSGADTADVAAQQVGALDASTDVVTMTIGGNDLGFADVITECALPGWISDCRGGIADARQVLRTQLPGRYDSLFATIASRAPGADVAIGGYPLLFNGQDCSFATFFSRSEMASLNDATGDLDALISERAGASGFDYVDPRSAFTGHAVCDDQEWVNGLSWPLQESFHPNRAGNQAYAAVFGPALQPSSPGAREQTRRLDAITPDAAPQLGARASLRAQADQVLAMDLTSRAHLAQAKAAGIPPGRVVSLEARLRSGNDATVRSALRELHRLDARVERRLDATG